MRAIISVSDKNGIEEFAGALAALGVEIFSTGGTKKALAAAGVPVRSVSELTGFPEILDGRVKTLHPAIHGGILARRSNPAHLAQLAEHGLGTIDMVVVNLYPFARTVADPNVMLADALENIDIGGPTMIRAAAKNFPDVVVLVDPADYGAVLGELKSGLVSEGTRRRLAAVAFQHTALYDTLIASYLRGDEPLPDRLTLALERVAQLRYGENPHQAAAFYRTLASGPQDRSWSLATASQLHGKELSYNNILDADAAYALASDFAAPTVAIIKHTNPCGLASGEDLADAYKRAHAGDPVAAFGGIVAVNRSVSREMAEQMASLFYEVVIAPDYDTEALEILFSRPDLRVLKVPLPPRREAAPQFRSVHGGLLAQLEDALPESDVPLRVVTHREPTLAELTDLLFAWRAAKHVKSNAIVLAQRLSLVGVGAGQMSRVESVEIATRKAGERASGSVLASDAFFPFPDGVELAAKAGVKAIIQPGGSMRDQAVIEAADKHHLAMVFTGRRHFRH